VSDASQPGYFTNIKKYSEKILFKELHETMKENEFSAPPWKRRYRNKFCIKHLTTELIVFFINYT